MIFFDFDLNLHNHQFWFLNLKNEVLSYNAPYKVKGILKNYGLIR